MKHQKKLLSFLLLTFCSGFIYSARRLGSASERVAQKYITASHQRSLNDYLYLKSREALFNQLQIEEYVFKTLALLERIVTATLDSTIARTFMKNITQSIKELPSLKQWTVHEKLYDKTVIDKHVAEYVVTFISQEAYAYIFKRTHNEKFAEKIAARVQGDVTGVLFIPDAFNLDIIERFLGKNLCEMLERYIRDYNG